MGGRLRDDFPKASQERQNPLTLGEVNVADLPAVAAVPAQRGSLLAVELGVEQEEEELERVGQGRLASWTSNRPACAPAGRFSVLLR